MEKPRSASNLCPELWRAVASLSGLEVDMILAGLLGLRLAGDRGAETSF